MNFALHPQLAADTLPVCELPFCSVLLMNNAHFPWLILVPQRAHLRELFDLTPEEYTLVTQEIRMVSEKFCAHTQAHKMNVAALGNMVPQLHIHIVARFENDAAWPAPVWGSTATPRPYSAHEAEMIVPQIRQLLGGI